MALDGAPKEPYNTVRTYINSFHCHSIAPMSLQIPEQDLPALVNLLRLPKETSRSLIKALQEEPPALLKKNLVSRISKKMKIRQSELIKLMDVIFKFFSGYKKSGLAIEEYLNEFRQTLAETTHPGLTFRDAEWVGQKSFLKKVLVCEDSIGITAKALSVLTDHARTFKDVRILTEFRPVFGSDPTEPPAAAVIFHMLKIEYRADHEENEFFVALDSIDLARLEEVVKRAKLKQLALERSLAPSKITLLEPLEQ